MCNSLEERVQDILCNVMGLSKRELKNIQMRDHFDSLDFTECLIELEEEFDINIDESEWDEVNTYKDIVELIENYTYSAKRK